MTSKPCQGCACVRCAERTDGPGGDHPTCGRPSGCLTRGGANAVQGPAGRDLLMRSREEPTARGAGFRRGPRVPPWYWTVVAAGPVALVVVPVAAGDPANPGWWWQLHLIGCLDPLDRRPGGDRPLRRPATSTSSQQVVNTRLRSCTKRSANRRVARQGPPALRRQHIRQQWEILLY